MCLLEYINLSSFRRRRVTAQPAQGCRDAVCTALTFAAAAAAVPCLPHRFALTLRWCSAAASAFTRSAASIIARLVASDFSRSASAAAAARSASLSPLTISRALASISSVMANATSSWRWCCCSLQQPAGNAPQMVERVTWSSFSKEKWTPALDVERARAASSSARHSGSPRAAHQARACGHAPSCQSQM